MFARIANWELPSVRLPNVTLNTAWLKGGVEACKNYVNEAGTLIVNNCTRAVAPVKQMGWGQIGGSVALVGMSVLAARACVLDFREIRTEKACVDPKVQFMKKVRVAFEGACAIGAIAGGVAIVALPIILK
jgi:hypothetical protein